MFRIQRGENQSLSLSSFNANRVPVAVRLEASCILTLRPILAALNDAPWGITEENRN